MPLSHLRARHIAAHGFDRSIAWSNYGTNPIATVDYSLIDLSPGELVNTNPPGGALTLNAGPGNRTGDPLFGADYSLGLASPAVDIGGSDLLSGDATDLRGTPRPADGNGDGTVLNDAGALERQYTADGAFIHILSHKLKLNRRGIGSIRLRCPTANEQPPPCTVSLKLKTARKVKFKGKKRIVTLAKTKPTKLAAGQTKKLKVRVRGAKLRLLGSSRAAREAVASAAVTDGYGESGAATAKLKLKPKKPR
jgi:hypothetical protein